jgi:small subunit ribosomal protein S2
VAEVLPVEMESAGEGFELLAAPRGAPDDLTRLSGVGPELATKLNEGGLFHFWQFASMSPADIEAVDMSLKLSGRIARDGWVAQAKALLEA